MYPLKEFYKCNSTGKYSNVPKNNDFENNYYHYAFGKNNSSSCGPNDANTFSSIFFSGFTPIRWTYFQQCF